MMNHISLMGRFVRDPELRRTQSGIAVASFSVACERDYKDAQSGERGVDFIDCVAWRNTAEFVANYFTKGRMAVVSGRLQIRKYTDRDGNKRSAAEIAAESVYFCDSPRESTSSGAYAPPSVPVDNRRYGDGAAGGTGTQRTLPGVNAGSDVYAAPASDFAVLEDEDGLMPF